ncbi:cholesterol transporter ABCA5-like isoform X3 [Dermacentor silvarum]|uniref:cholesterol transporter ABCA5-like isoform X3 n=1 Tax=Dermacentor silvarum TaxID=543639 RepID=UPI002101168F|nr:cholesterol transporter ABCA5-like isoform X3 [Dermacentor silvarum]
MRRQLRRYAGGEECVTDEQFQPLLLGYHSESPDRVNKAQARENGPAAASPKPRPRRLTGDNMAVPRRNMFWTQLLALIWRNYLLKKTEKAKTFWEVVMPLLMVASLMSIRSGLKPSSKPPHYTPVGHVRLVTPSHLAQLTTEIMAAPTTPQTTLFMRDVVNFLNANTYTSGFNFSMYNSSKDMEAAFRQNSTRSSVGVVFEGDDLTKNGSYQLRFPLRHLPSPELKNVGIEMCRIKHFVHSSDTTLCPAGAYYSSGFSVLQAAVDFTFIKLWTRSDVRLPEVVVRLLPKPAYVDPGTTWRTLVPLYLTLAFSPFVSVLCVNIVLEKERKIKEGMLMMGMMPSAYWTAWSLVEAIVVANVAAIMTLMVYVLHILPNTDIFIVFVLSLLYGLTIVMFSFMATPFFNKSKVAGSVLGLLMLVFSFFYMFAVFLKGRVPVWVFYVVALLSPAAFTLGIEKVSQNDVRGAMHWADLFEDDFSVGSAIIMLSVDMFLYGFLAYYFDAIVPGEFGQHRGPWFILHCLGFGRGGRSTEPDDLVKPDNTPNPDVEDRPAELLGREAIKVQHLRKVFTSWRKEPVVAVDGVSLTMHEGQIAALLGHNGAGKSTLLNMLVGTLKPSSGSARIYDLHTDNPDDVAQIRGMLGVCLQEDILFDTLTARQHLRFFARLKGVPATSIDLEVKNILLELDLAEKADVQAIKLSGGQKRKLSVGIALIGDPKIVFLDEPSSGMDPYSRRHLWSELQKRKEGKVIVLTTHFMDEADILADWKAILCKGKLRCAGTSLFLKNRFGIGYHLTMVVDQGTDKAHMNQLVQQFVPTATVYRSTSTELAFILPMDSTYNFANLFAAIEEAIAEGTMGVRSYGISMTTLEEVFLKMGEVERPEEMHLRDIQTDIAKSAVRHTPPPTKKALSLGEPRVQAAGSVSSTPRTSHRKEIEEMELLKTNKETMPVSTVEPNALQAFMAFFKARLLLFVRAPMHVVPLVVLPVIMVMLSYTFLSKSEVPVNKLGLFTPDFYPEARVIEAYSTAPRQSEQIRLYEESMRKQNINVSWRNGSVTLDNIPPNSYYASVPENLGGDYKYTNPLTLLINDSHVHTLPILQSLTFNTLYAALEKNESVLDERRLRISSYPWPQRGVEKVFDAQLYTWTMMMSVVLAYMPSLIAVEVVEDRQNKVKNQLRVSGLLFCGYWFTVLLSHAALYLLSVLLTVLALVALQVPFLTEPVALLAIITLFVLYVPASLVVCYVLTHLFNKHETAKGVLPFLALLCSMFPAVPVTILDMMGSSRSATALHYTLCLLVPFYIPNGGLYYITKTSVTIETKLSNGYEADKWMYFDWDSNILVTYVACVIHMLVYYFLLRMADIGKAGGRMADAFWITRRIIDITPNGDLPEKEDADVKAERQRVSQMDISLMPKPPVVYVHELRKVYEEGARCRPRNHVKIAIRNLSMAIDKGDIFGLLGPNGAGKTSTMKVIVGEESPSSGRVAVGGFEITSNLCRAFKMLGYCPQHDALWNNLTLREHLQLFASLRGIRYNEIDAVTDWLMDKLNIREHADKRAKQLSGGTKRKLSYAISMLGKPRIVLLDEPSTGMDPQSKRFLWDTICSTFPQGGERGALLTTHSMEEADALCTKVGIMVRGALRCLGSTQHLKNKYGAGYTLDIKMQRHEGAWEKNLGDLKGHVKRVFPSATLREGFQDRLTYDIPQAGVTSLANVFVAMDEAKAKFSIEEFSFSQTTLEQVFLGFAKEQELAQDDEDVQIHA